MQIYHIRNLQRDCCHVHVCQEKVLLQISARLVSADSNLLQDLHPDHKARMHAGENINDSLDVDWDGIVDVA